MRQVVAAEQSSLKDMDCASADIAMSAPVVEVSKSTDMIVS